MEIELKNVAYANNDVYQIGNVFSRLGTPILVAKTRFFEGGAGYCFVDLDDGKILTPVCSNLEILAKEYGFSGDVLVKAKLIVDYKLDGDTEDEDTE
jgi:hypothetical protein